MSTHEYALSIADRSRSDLYTAGCHDAGIAIRAHRETYRRAKQEADAAVAWCATRGIEGTVAEQVAAYRAGTERVIYARATLDRTHVTLAGRLVAHRDMMLAASQGDQDLSAQYREIITRDILPVVRDREAAANKAINGAPATVSGGTSGGHGSYSAVSAVAESAEAAYWYDLRCDYEHAAAGRGPREMGLRPWQHA